MHGLDPSEEDAADTVFRDVVHGRPVKNTEALANPEALRLYEGISDLRT